VAALLGIDPKETCEASAYGHAFTIGCLPAGKVRELSVREARVLAPLAKGEDGRIVLDQIPPEAEADWLGVAGEWLRWGLRAVDSKPLATAEVRYAGETWQALTPAALAPWLRADAGLVALVLAAKVKEANVPSADDVLGLLHRDVGEPR
jgi:hypothetical protein